MSLREIYAADGSIVRTVITNDADGTVTHLLEQDCEPILRGIAAKRDQPMSNEMRPLADVPMTVIERAMREGWINDQAAWRKWLNDPDNRAFRIWEGRV